MIRRCRSLLPKLPALWSATVRYLIMTGVWRMSVVPGVEALLWPCHHGKPFGSFTTVMPGRHNCLNGLAVIAVLERLGLAPDVIARELQLFKGVRRRQEVRGVVGGVTVIDDFAHHPTAVRETLAALRTAYEGQRLLAVFEPRTNSSRRRVFQQDYLSVFDAADVVMVKEPDVLTTVPEEQRFSAKELVAGLQERGVDGYYFPNTDLILDYLSDIIRPDDVVAILSNGGFDNIHVRLLSRLDQLFPANK